MTGFGFFQPAIAAMTAQSQALSVIGGNIANVTTDGFKRSDVNFQSLVSRTWASAPAEINAQSRQSDLGGVGATIQARISETGELGLTGRDLDAAIDGPGLFVYRDAGGGLVYGRGGHFQAMGEAGASGAAATTAFLGDGDGHVVQGWPVAADGSHPTDAGGLVPVRVDAEAAGTTGQATTTVRLGVNLPGTAPQGALESYDLGAFDAGGRAHPLRLDFTRQPIANTWSLSVTAAEGDTLTIDPSQAGGGPGGPVTGQPLSFASNGTLNGTGRYTIGLTHADGTTSQFVLDMGGATQYAGPFSVQTADQDGLPPGRLADVSIDDRGRVIGRFDNGQARALYVLPLADFANADGLEALDGNLYRASTDSGQPTLTGAGGSGTGRIAAGAVERSNVRLEAEFARMMVTQNAYNSAATAFRTLDEMAELARDIKR